MSQIRFAVDEDTMVQTLPTIKDKMAEIQITHCSLDLTEELNTIKRPEIRRITPINMGEESWLLRIDLARPDILLKAKVIDGILEINVYSDEDFRTRFATCPKYGEFVEDLFASDVVLPPSVDLRPLYSTSIAYPMSVMDVPFEVLSLTGDAIESEWADVDQARDPVFGGAATRVGRADREGETRRTLWV